MDLQKNNKQRNLNSKSKRRSTLGESLNRKANAQHRRSKQRLGLMVDTHEDDPRFWVSR